LQSPGSRRGVAPCRLYVPPAAPFSPALSAAAIVRRGQAALRSAPPLRPLASAPVRPCGAPSARRQAQSSGILYFSFCPVPADFTSFRLVLGRCGRLRDRENRRTLRSAAIRLCSWLLADRRFALTALALRLFETLARSQCGLASRGRPGSRAFAQLAPRPHGDADAPPPALWWWPSCRLSPLLSATGGHGRSFSLRSP
jgi:hypothetical protein